MDKKLTVDDILEKKFKTKKIGGLDANDVDSFLNEIIEDYELFEKTISDLKKQLEQLREENFRVKMNALNSKSKKIDITQDVEIQKLSNNTKNLESNTDSDLKSRIDALESELNKIKEFTTKI